MGVARSRCKRARCASCLWLLLLAEQNSGCCCSFGCCCGRHKGCKLVAQCIWPAIVRRLFIIVRWQVVLRDGRLLFCSPLVGFIKAQVASQERSGFANCLGAIKFNVAAVVHHHHHHHRRRHIGRPLSFGGCSSQR